MELQSYDLRVVFIGARRCEEPWIPRYGCNSLHMSCRSPINIDKYRMAANVILHAIRWQ